jgi:fatty-acyl-CoA synthase
MAWVQLRPGAEPLTAESLRAFCAGQLAHFKAPATSTWWTTSP